MIILDVYVCNVVIHHI